MTRRKPAPQPEPPAFTEIATDLLTHANHLADLLNPLTGIAASYAADRDQLQAAHQAELDQRDQHQAQLQTEIDRLRHDLDTVTGRLNRLLAAHHDITRAETTIRQLANDTAA